jgi:radical SAM superfamily enzyme YgiQ (UPF0313 family)
MESGRVPDAERIPVSTSKRSGNRVALVAMYPTPDPAMPELISNHGLRMIEATLRAAGIGGLDLHIFDLHDAAVDELVDALIQLDPDVIAFSSYLWSFPLFAKVAIQLRRDDPTRLIIFGGPSARSSMFDQLPFRSLRDAVDLLIINEGELTFLEIMKATDRHRDALGAIRGIAQWYGSEWRETQTRPLADLNQLPSPYVMGLVPPGGLGVLQTYRGCPYTCSFCEWGTMESPKRVRTSDHLAEEFVAMAKNQVTGALLVDAGLNLNSRAFDQLEIAADQTGFFRERKLICEVYPAKVTDQHIRFLSKIGKPLVGVGLQSFDNAVLAHVERSFDEERFEYNMQRLTDVARVAIEIIMGLPGDSPEQFRSSFHRARSFPCALRVYHCCVLPSALMVRSPPEHAINYDPVTLKMRSCLGWTEEAMLRECDFLDQQTRSNGGSTGEYFWVFSAPERYSKGERLGVSPPCPEIYPAGSTSATTGERGT